MFQVIRDLEIKRKQEVDQAMKELGSLRIANEELKKKLDAAKCRVRNLECDTITIRQKMQTFMEKSKHDDLLINEQRVSYFRKINIPLLGYKESRLITFRSRLLDLFTPK